MAKLPPLSLPPFYCISCQRTFNCRASMPTDPPSSWRPSGGREGLPCLYLLRREEEMGDGWVGGDRWEQKERSTMGYYKRKASFSAARRCSRFVRLACCWREGGSRGDKRVGWARCQEGNFVAARKMRCCRCIFLTKRLFRYISRSNYVIFSFTFPGDIQDEDKLMKASSEKSASTNLYLYQVKKRPEDLARNWEGTIPQ